MSKKRPTLPVALCIGLTLLSASGCSTAATDACWPEPITTSRQDVLTPETERQIIAHNRAWEAVGCGRIGK